MEEQSREEPSRPTLQAETVNGWMGTSTFADCTQGTSRTTFSEERQVCIFLNLDVGAKNPALRAGPEVQRGSESPTGVCM